VPTFLSRTASKFRNGVGEIIVEGVYGNNKCAEKSSEKGGSRHSHGATRKWLRPTRNQNMKRALTCSCIMLLGCIPVFGQIVLQPPASGSGSGTVVTILPGPATSTSDMLDIDCPGSPPFLCFSVGSTGSLSFGGNSFMLGVSSQSSPSNIGLYGGLQTTTTFPDAYLQEYSPALAPFSSGLPSGDFVFSGSGSAWSGNYCFYVTYVDTNITPAGESAASPMTCVSTGAHATLTVTSPGSSGAPAGANAFNIYACNVSSPCGPATSTYLQNTGGPVLLSSSNSGAINTFNMTGSAPTAPINLFYGYWFMSPTTPGIPCFTTTVPTGDCTNSTVIALNPMTTQGDLIAGGAPSTLYGSVSVAPAARVAAGTAGQVLIGGATPSFSSTIGVQGTTAASLTLAGKSGTPGSLVLNGATSGQVTIESPASFTSYNFVLPTGAGTSGYPLVSAGGSSPMTFGVLSTGGGGTGTSSTLTGLVRGGSAMTAAELSGDATTSGSNLVTVVKVNGGSIPASANVVSTNGSSQLAASTADNVSLVLQCAAASGSGTAYTCSTSPTFTPAAGDRIQFKADVSNTGAATLNVNSTSAKSIKTQAGALALVANQLLAGQWVDLIYDGTEWQMLGPQPAYVVFGAFTGGTTLTSGTNYYAAFSGSTGSTFPAENRINQPAAAAGTITAVYCSTAVAPGSSTTLTFQWRDGGSNMSGVACSISGSSSTSGNTTGLSVPFSAGDLLDMLLTCTGTCSSGTYAQWSARVVGQ
jgi:hypothetical protein